MFSKEPKEKSLEDVLTRAPQAGQNTPVASNIPSPYGLCQGVVDAVERGPKLNRIKKFGKKGGAWGG